MNKRKSNLKFHFTMPVWGHRYVQVTLNAALPSQLTPGNLLQFPFLSTSTYEFYTTKRDQEIIVASPVFKLLDTIMETKFIYIDEMLSDKKWSVLRYCHREMVKSADKHEAALFFLCPDQIWTECSFTNAAFRIAEGYSVVLCPGPRTVEETIVPTLRNTYLSADGCSMPVPPRDLVKVGMNHLHREMITWFWDDPSYSIFKVPPYIFFNVAGEGFSAFCYILHPVVLNAEVRHAPFKRIFDQDYLMAACPNFKKHYIAQDSDEVFHFEVSPRDVGVPAMPVYVGSLNYIEAMRTYGEQHYNWQHRQMVKKPIRIHHTTLSSKKWNSVEKRGKTIIRKISWGWKVPDFLLAFIRPSDLQRRMLGRHAFVEVQEDIPKKDRILLKIAEQRMNKNFVKWVFKKILLINT